MGQSKKTKAVDIRPEEETQPLHAAIGERLRSLREANQKRQEDIAAAARTWGLEWERATVAAIELGRRHLSLEEFLLLPGILRATGILVLDNEGGGRFAQLADVLPIDTFADLTLTPITFASSHGLRRLLSSQTRLGASNLPYLMRPHQTTLDSAIARLVPKLSVKHLKIATALLRYFRQHGKDRGTNFAINTWADRHGDAELKAAVKLDVPPYVVALAAWFTWGHSLTKERDRLLAEQVIAEQVKPDLTPPRTVQALRGHITRALLSELQPHVDELMRIGNKELSEGKEE